MHVYVIGASAFQRWQNCFGQYHMGFLLYMIPPAKLEKRLKDSLKSETRFPVPSIADGRSNLIPGPLEIATKVRDSNSFLLFLSLLR